MEFNIDTMVENIKEKFKYALYSPELNEIVLVEGIHIWTDQDNKKMMSYADRELFGNVMAVEKFDKLYTIYLGEL